MSFNIESVAAKLVPFDLYERSPNLREASSVLEEVPTVSTPTVGPQPTTPTITAPQTDMVSMGLFGAEGFGGFNVPQETAIPSRPLNQPSGNTLTKVGEGTRTYVRKFLPSIEGPVRRRAILDGDPLSPIHATGGLVFPYTPAISEGVNIRYDNTELVHANEGVFTYRNTDNVRISLADCTWTCDTYAKARYALAVLHFFRSYSYMDFGRASGTRRGGTGRPPSPMWFSAYGSYIYNEVPVLLEKADWTFPVDGDYVGIPNPDTPEAASETLNYATGAIGNIRARAPDYSWMPMKFTASISLVVQHSVKYWTHTFSLDDFRSGRMIQRRDDGSNGILGDTTGSWMSQREGE